MNPTTMLTSKSDMERNKRNQFGQNRKKKRKTWPGFIFIVFTVCIQSIFASSGELKVIPLVTRLSGVLDSNVSLACSSSVKPILCLWKTPYGHVYTLSEGVFAESGRLRHEQPEGSELGCGLEIVGVEARDKGDWQCEVGGLLGDAFETDTAVISLETKRKPESKPDAPQSGHTSRQEVGNDVILHCSSESEVHLCRWKTPYLNTYIVGEGIYVERGRIQWLGKDPNYDCTIRVAKLDLRDAGTWVCELGSSTTETFQVQTKEFVIDIETPLKLSAPTSLMQNANTDATLVCHANKPYDECLWTTPYGSTYSFSSANSSHENGRIAFFGFASTDCGVIVHNVASKDNGDWLCQLHSRNGEIFQNATDIVPLYADLTTAAKPRAIPDYDYDKKANQYDDDYTDYDFSKVGSEAAPSQQAPPTKIQLIDTKSGKPNHRTTPTVFLTTTERAADLELTKITPSTDRSTTFESSKATDSTTPNHSTSTTQRSPSTTQRSPSTTSRSPSTTSPAAPLSIFRDDGVRLSGVNALELELLSRISGTRRDSRPILIGTGPGDQEAVDLAVEFESSRTDIPVVDQTERLPAETTTPDSRERMRLREIQRIRDERRKSALQREKDDSGSSERQSEVEVEVKVEQQDAKKSEEEKTKIKQELEAERQRQMAVAREEEKRRQQEIDKKRLEERQKQIEEQRKREEEERKKKDEEEKKKKEEEEKKQKEEEEEKRRRENKEKLERAREEDRQRQIQIAREEEKRRQLEIERKKIEERQKQIEEQRKKEEEEKKKRDEEEKKRREEEERKLKEEEEEKKRKIEDEKKKKEEEEEARRKELKEKEEKEREAERQRQIQIQEEEKRRQQEIDKKRTEERQRQIEEQRRREDERRKQKEEEERKRIEKEEKEKEERAKIEAEKKEEAERLKIETEQRRIREEQKRRQIEEDRKRKREEELKLRLEAERKRKAEEERRLAEIERKRQEERERARIEEETKKKLEEEKLLKEIEQKKKDEEEKEKEEAARQKKEEDERRKQREESAKREEERRKRLEAQQKRDEAERVQKLEEEKAKKVEEEQEKLKESEKQKQEDVIKSQREDDRRKALERKRGEERERELQLQQRKLEDQKPSVVEETTKPDAEIQTNTTISPKSDELPSDNSRALQASGSPPLTNLLPDKNRENERKHCVLPAFPSNGNVTCGNLIPEDTEYRLIYGQSCILTCKAGYVSLELRESRCFNGRMTQRLECVPPDALLIVGGRSDTYGVLSSVELVTGRGVCRGAVPPLPAMRWRMIAHAIDRERVLACGGVNIFGDPKADCWIMGFNPEPFWSEASSMNVARDAAAWAQEGNFLFVLGGSLGKFSGYTDSVEMYSVETGTWLEGPKMSTSRYSHCAVGLGNGSLIVTGGYGGLNMVERLDVADAAWVNLPELNPVRAQHGCALVDLYGEQGVIVVGGDSGGTRLKDVRFLPIKPTHTEWRKVADMLTARWGRPGVGIVGGRLTVAAGWNGVKDLDTVEYYDEVKREWRRQASRLQTERRWPSSTPISLFLFPKCAQRRE